MAIEVKAVGRRIQVTVPHALPLRHSTTADDYLSIAEAGELVAQLIDAIVAAHAQPEAT